jgi:pimeloyl-ACP methyl ester carboxylesterase
MEESMERRLRGACLAVAVTIAGLAAAAFVVRRDSAQAVRQHPPTGRFLTVDGVRLHYLDRGQGSSTVVLLHGNGGMIADLETSGLVDRLAQRHRVLVFDRPGYGHSQAPRDIAWTPEAQARLLGRALTRLGVDRPIVFGHSWGALVALALALEEPRSLRGLVLAAGFYFPEQRADVAIVSAPAIPLFGDLLRATIVPLIGRLLAPGAIRKMFAPRKPTARFRAAYPLSLQLRPEQIRTSSEEAALMVPAAARLQSRYRDLDMPVWIFAGAQDRLVNPYRHAARLHARVAGSKVHVLPGLGHMLHHFAAEQIADAVEQIDADATPAARAAAAG